MFYRFKFWLSFQLLMLGVRTAPDERVQEWIKYGLKVAGSGIEKDILENESF